MKIKAVIFDLDGTLIHTKPEYVWHLLNRCFEETGIPPTRENIEIIWHGTNKEQFIASHGVDPELFWKKFTEYDTVDERTKYIVPYEDCWILKNLSEKGIKLGLVTNTTFHMAEHQVDVLRLHGIQFDAIVVPFDEKNNLRIKLKPHPEGVLECLQMLDVKSSEAILVGDSPADAEAARLAGVLDVFIERGEHLIPVDATIKIKSLEEILKLIE